MSNPNVYLHEGQWFFRTESDGEEGPFPNEEAAHKEFVYYCDQLMGRISPPEWRDVKNPKEDRND